jgi:hypothetical protein
VEPEGERKMGQRTSRFSGAAEIGGKNKIDAPQHAPPINLRVPKLSA